MQPVLITTTTRSKEEADTIATRLLNNKLAACVNIIGPISSVYVWEGKVAHDDEYKLFIKSFENKWENIKSCVRENHSYTVPEISMIHIKAMSEDYLSWMNEVL